MRTIQVKSADGIEFTIEFHREADRCWHLSAPWRVVEAYLPFEKYGDITYPWTVGREEFGRIESTSLERLMTFLAHHIGATEF